MLFTAVIFLSFILGTESGACDYCKYCNYCGYCDECPCQGRRGCEFCSYCKLCPLCKIAPCDALCGASTEGGLFQNFANYFGFDKIPEIVTKSLAHIGGENAKLPEDSEIQRQLKEGSIDLDKVQVKKQGKNEKQEL